MRLNNLVIYNLKIKNIIIQFPSFNDGFIFIKIINKDGNYGFGEPSPYIFDTKKLTFL